MKKNVFNLLAFGLLLIVLTACKEEESAYDQQLAKDVENIERYLADNSLSATRFNNYIYKVEVSSSAGEKVDTSKIVEAIIHLETLKGETFYLDSSYIYQTKYGFYLSEYPGAIPGPNYAVLSMNEGEISRFLFTSNQFFWSNAFEYDGIRIDPYEIISSSIELKEVRTFSEQEAYEAEVIKNYGLENELITEEQVNSDGFYKIILEDGSGTEKIGNSTTIVNLDYKGYLLDGTIIGEGSNITLNPSQVIPGFQMGLEGLKAGSKVTLLIPSQLGYGSEPIFNQQSARMTIRPFSPLVFEVTINGF